MKILCFITVMYIQVHAEDSFNLTNTTVSSNITVVDVDAERIIKPSSSPSEQIDKIVNINGGNSTLKLNFKPSPQLDVHFEENKTPVFPAFSEAKRFSNVEIHAEPWTVKMPHMTDSPWASKIRFPTPNPQEHPYPFVTDFDNVEKSQNHQSFHTVPKGVGSVSPPIYGLLTEESLSKHDSHFGSIDKFESGNLMLRPNMNYENRLEEKPHAVRNVFPWKNLAKFLTAAIPIGILIGALTPNVINITPVNMTENRVRLDENESRTKKQLTYVKGSESYACEERILCVLLIGAASSKNGADHAENFLRLFTERENDIVKKSEELKKLMKAVRKGNCNDFICKKIKKI